jgi:hypothetical protein
MMDALGLPGMQETDFTVSISAGRPRPIVTDESAIPAMFIRTISAPNMQLISAAVREGNIPPGVEISNSAPTLTVRTK